MALIYIPSSTTLSLFPLILLLTLLLHFHQCSGLKIQAFKYFYANSSCFVFALSSPIGMHYHSVFTPPFIHKAGVVSQKPDSQRCIWLLMLLKLSVAQLCCPWPTVSQPVSPLVFHLGVINMISMTFCPLSVCLLPYSGSQSTVCQSKMRDGVWKVDSSFYREVAAACIQNQNLKNRIKIWHFQWYFVY